MQHTATPHQHPKSLWHLCYNYIFLTFPFGIINSLLVLYLTNRVQLSQKDAYALFAAFNSLVFTLPVLSGYLAQRFGYRVMTGLGIGLCALGAGAISLPYFNALYFGLAAFAFGLATCATTFYCLVDFSYPKQDKRRESGFTLFYLIFNFGFLFSVGAGGYLANAFHYSGAFMFAAGAALIGLITFLFTQKHIQFAASRQAHAPILKSWPVSTSALSAISLVVIAACFFLLKFVALNNILLFMVVAGVSGYILLTAFKQPERKGRLKLFAFLCLSIISIAFWALYMLEPSLLTIFIAHNVKREILGHIIPASSFYSLDAFYIILFGFAFSWMWRQLAKRGRNLSLPTKFALSLLSMGIGYWIFALGIHFADAQHFTHASWVFLGYWFFACAELLLSPIGLAMVGRLAPHGKEGVLMGAWQLFIGLSAVISGYLAKLAVTPRQGLPLQTNPIYSHALLTIGGLAIGVGIIAALLIPTVKKLI